MTFNGGYVAVLSHGEGPIGVSPLLPYEVARSCDRKHRARTARGTRRGRLDTLIARHWAHAAVRVIVLELTAGCRPRHRRRVGMEEKEASIPGTNVVGSSGCSLAGRRGRRALHARNDRAARRHRERWLRGGARPRSYRPEHIPARRGPVPNTCPVTLDELLTESDQT